MQNKPQPPHDSDPKSAVDFMQAHRNLKQLVKKAAQLKQINQLVHDILPENYRPHCQVMNISDHQLIIQVTSGAWATKVYYLNHELINSLHYYDFLRHIKKITCKVRFRSFNDHPTHKTHAIAHTLSQRTRYLLDDAANNINHPELRAALKAIAKP